MLPKHSLLSCCPTSTLPACGQECTATFTGFPFLAVLGSLLRLLLYRYFCRFFFFRCTRKLAFAVFVQLLSQVFLFSLYSEACFCCFCTATFAGFPFLAVLGSLLRLFLYHYFRKFSFFRCTRRLASALFVPLLLPIFLFSLFFRLVCH